MVIGETLAQMVTSFHEMPVWKTKEESQIPVFLQIRSVSQLSCSES